MRKLSLKRGEVEARNVVIGFILGAIVLVIAIVIIVNVNNQTKSATTLDCGNSIVGKGACKPTCEAGELKVKGYGCSDNDDGTPIYCCVDTNYETEDHGGDGDYRFEVFDVGLDPSQITSGKCKESATWTYTCTSGQGLKIKMSVTNTGNFPLDIFANPKVGETYPKQGTPLRIARGDSRVLAVDLTLDSKKSYKIYGAAKCTSTICTEKFGDQGIFKLNDDQYFTVIIN